MDVGVFVFNHEPSHQIFSYLWLTYVSLTGPSTDMEEAQRSLARNHLPISEHEGDARKYRASYSVYIRAPDESQGQPRDPSRFIGRVGGGECREYGVPLPDSLTVPREVLDRIGGLRP